MQWRSECRRRDALKTIVVQVGVQVDAYACGRFCFIKLSLLLIAIEARSDDGLETSISINPQGHDLRLDSRTRRRASPSTHRATTCVLTPTLRDSSLPSLQMTSNGTQQ